MMRLNLVIVVLVFACVGEARKEFRRRLPNGFNVPNPCARDRNWAGVGHIVPEGDGTARNSFGEDFKAAGFRWSLSLCRKDSDGDGKTNGQELGDPDCQWNPDSVSDPDVTDVNSLSHPGICEPVNSAGCRESNYFLGSVESCAKIMRTDSSQPSRPSQPSQPSDGNSNWCPAIGAAGVRNFEIRMNRAQVPTSKLSYYCQQFAVQTDGEYHIVAWEPINENFEFLHNIFVYGCDDSLLDNNRNYTKTQACSLMPPECQALLFTWTFGQPKRCYNNNYGIPLGKNAYKKILLQAHYTNTLGVPNVVDSSGLRIYYTKPKRQFDGGMLTIGQLDIVIAPDSLKTVNAKPFISDECSTNKLGPKGTKYFLQSVLVYMHQLGVHSKLQLLKSNGRIINLLDMDGSFQRPITVSWGKDDAPVLESGDNFNLECTYNSSLVNGSYTLFGEKFTDEMCYAMIEIYPKPNNVSYVTIFNVDQYNDCVWLTPPADKLANCTDTFNKELQNILNSTEADGFSRFCDDNTYPSQNCSQKCFGFLKRHNFTANTCMEGALFRYLAGFTHAPTYGDILQIQSQTDRCLWLAESQPVPGAKRASADAIKSSLIAVMVTSLVSLISHL